MFFPPSRYQKCIALLLLPLCVDPHFLQSHSKMASTHPSSWWKTSHMCFEIGAQSPDARSRMKAKTVSRQHMAAGRQTWRQHTQPSQKVGSAEQTWPTVGPDLGTTAKPDQTLAQNHICYRANCSPGRLTLLLPKRSRFWKSTINLKICNIQKGAR